MSWNVQTEAYKKKNKNKIWKKNLEKNNLMDSTVKGVEQDA